MTYITIKRTLIITLITLFAMPSVSAQNVAFSNEKLNYEIVYHWGIIWKHAANATLSIQNSGNNYNASLIARTISWADNAYKVRDTLTCTMLKDGIKPIKYVKSSHEGKHSGRDIVNFSYTENTTNGSCIVERKDKDTRFVSLQTQGQAFDMLSVFYYLRTLDFNKLATNKTLRTTIFSGRKKENLTVTFIKQETVKLRDKSSHNAYHITFKFTQDGKKKSSDDIHCWISTDDRHIPLLLKGSVPIGEVRVYYKNK